MAIEESVLVGQQGCQFAATDREALAAMCRERAGQAEEKSAEWYAFGTAGAFLSGTGSIEWVRSELQKAREECLFYAQRDSNAPDAQYGTYGAYMRAKAMIYQHLLFALPRSACL